MSLKVDLERDLQTPVRIKTGGPGSLDVFVNGQKIFSHKQTGRLPNSAELVGQIRAMAH